MLVLIDGDILTYRVGFASEVTIYKLTVDDQVTYHYSKSALNAFIAQLKLKDYEVTEFTSIDDLPVVDYSLNSYITNILEKLHSLLGEEELEASIYLTSSDRSNFRYSLIDDYKANRTKRKPMHYEAIRQLLADDYYARIVKGQEADDALSIKAHENGLDNTVIVSLDKDLDMVPCLHYNFVKDILYPITPIVGIRNFYKQMLTGDRADNIEGIRGIGKVKAGRLIDPLSTEIEMWHTVYAQYEALGLPEDKLLNMLITKGRLLWMRTYEGEMWEPPVS